MSQDVEHKNYEKMKNDLTQHLVELLYKLSFQNMHAFFFLF